MNPRNAWPSVVLAGVALAGLATMAVFHVDKDTILFIGALVPVPVLTALIAAQGAANASAVQAVQQQTNGNQARVLDIVDRLGHLLAAAPAVPPHAESTSTQPPTTDGGS